ncbi:hypothetical protein BKA69DRAFT_1125441 [Paraphysoderma sedebokerense]|nr:hypothetical protein BKA69DRAFT_1125441 [Paraphysoderma sedebokerense]
MQPKNHQQNGPVLIEAANGFHLDKDQRTSYRNQQSYPSSAPIKLSSVAQSASTPTSKQPSYRNYQPNSPLNANKNQQPLSHHMNGFSHSQPAATQTPSSQSPGSVCRGRVQTLETHVPSAWWSSIFSDDLYLKTDGDVVEDPDITRSEVDLLESYAFLDSIFKRGLAQPDSPNSGPKILDLCCGQGRHSLELARRYPHLQLYGHDQSKYLINLAKERSQQQGVTDRCRFTVGDCRTIPYPDASFDLVMIMGNSFGYFSSTTSDLQVLKECSRVLKKSEQNPTGYLILDLTDGYYMKHNFSPRTWEWIDDSTFVCRERQLSKDGKCLVSREVVTETAKGVVRDQFYMERLYERDEVEMLLEMGGFGTVKEKTDGAKETAEKVEGVEVVTAAKELSKRKEDLGMMEQRMLVFAVKEKDYLPLPSASPQLSIDTTSTASTDHHSSLDSAINVSSPANGPDSKPKSASSLSLPPPASSHVIKTTNKGANQVKFDTTPPLIPHLLVLFGDSSIPCFGKLNNTWNPEDVATRQKLVDMLAQFWNLSHASSSSLKLENGNAIGNGVEEFVVIDESEAKIGRLTIVEKHDSMLKTLLEIMNSSKSQSNASMRTREVPFVLNLCDEGFENDALKELHVPALLEMLNMQYSGAGPQCLGFCYDKGLVNQTAAALGIPTPQETYYLNSLTCHSHSSSHFNPSFFHSLLQHHSIPYPAFIKPLRGDNSLGITSRSVVYNQHELFSYIQDLFQMGINDIIIQEYLTGPEFSVGMIGNPESGYYFLPILQVDYSCIVEKNLVPILGYESKWDPDSPYWNDIKYVRATLPVEVEELLKVRCTVLFERFGCRDYARFDFRAQGDFLDTLSSQSPASSSPSSGSLNSSSESSQIYEHTLDSTNPASKIKLLEVNPNPGWCWDGKMAYMAKLEGHNYQELMMMILNAAWERTKTVSI